MPGSDLHLEEPPPKPPWPQVKLGFGAVEAIVEVFRNNRVLLEQIDEEVLDCLVQMAYSVPRPRPSPPPPSWLAGWGG